MCIIHTHIIIESIVTLQYELTLKKNPTLGLGITGGKDSENAIYPRDKVPT